MECFYKSSATDGDGNGKQSECGPVTSICKFCGVAICTECRKVKPYVTAGYDENNDDPKFIVVEDASWCGRCNPTPQPIAIPESD